MRRLLRITIVLLGAALPAAGAQATKPASSSVPLTLQATCDAQASPPVMRIRLTNSSPQTTAVVVGFHADGGKTRVVDSVDVIAIRPATGADEVYMYVNPKYSLAKGTPWIVSLKPGETHDVELLLRDFISTMTYTGLDPTVAGGTRFLFEARPAAKQQVWTGKIETKLDACRQ